LRGKLTIATIVIQLREAKGPVALEFDVVLFGKTVSEASLLGNHLMGVKPFWGPRALETPDRVMHSRDHAAPNQLDSRCLQAFR